MPTVKCDKCGHSVEVEGSTKKDRLPLFFIILGAAILAYGNIVSNPSIIITILGEIRDRLIEPTCKDPNFLKDVDAGYKWKMLYIDMNNQPITSYFLDYTDCQ